MGSDQVEAAEALVRAKLAECLAGLGFTGMQAFQAIDAIMNGVIKAPPMYGAVLDLMGEEAQERSYWLGAHMALLHQAEEVYRRLSLLEQPKSAQDELEALQRRIEAVPAWRPQT